MQDSFTEAISDLIKSVQGIWHPVTDKINRAVQQVFSKPYSNVSEKPEQKPAFESDTQDTQENLSEPETESELAEPAPEDDDRFIIRGIYSVFVSNTGLQGYKNYVMIIPAGELNFQIPLTYETKQKNQEQKHDFLSEKAVPTEFKKKQAEYDDF